ALGLGGVAKSEQVAADLMRRAFGDTGAMLISLVVAVAALTTANATAFTGGRRSYACGCDFKQFGSLGRSHSRTRTPVHGLLLAAVIVVDVIRLVVFPKQCFAAIVEYAAPVFWSLFLLAGIASFVLRHKDGDRERPFRVPLYPIPPILFCLTCGYLLYS